jgi:Zn-dependent protease with chaperone function
LALPGGGVVVTSGLLDILETEEELMFVLGHELGHFVHRDHLRGMGRAIVVQLLLGMMSLTTGVDASLGLEIAFGAMTSAHSREQEVHADAVGAEVLATLKGGDVSAAHRALNALHDALGTSALDGINFLRSHPVGSVRREALDALIQTRGWQELKTRGTPLAEALRSACESTTEVTEEERVAEPPTP